MAVLFPTLISIFFCLAALVPIAAIERSRGKLASTPKLLVWAAGVCALVAILAWSTQVAEAQCVAAGNPEYACVHIGGTGMRVVLVMYFVLAALSKAYLRVLDGF